ncbi:farnesol dehydrogenase-like [Polistes fuscatus]|uniref:farnesol dehydrogenase-like n=1 Tax=Polistes fuscatus TaxID=30207 RepID=UPI001CA8A132|nr:farnesol dehydrogenase-like [Polistes fuscatus]XP_043500006.1 farnesol dehydrogenase-like [Polistes fuscatus]XP_043500007.1 farnesol dehydrogenase-like [Polistes fuscatus]XP_043500008.1 farnesol dehydrogenase-like [Polistes fuscatus]XP_043500009.1 farnesol dehydrogenase-like [Polistes fuscatus]
MNRWEGKVAVVTGSASGIGKAITRALLERKIIVVGLDIQNEEDTKTADNTKNKRNRYYPLRCDVSCEDELDAAFSFVDEKLNGVDIMVNNAGVINYQRVIESDRKTFEKLLNINVLAVAVCINRAVRSMRKRNVEGHVFTINSITGHRIPSGSPSDIEGSNGWNLYPTTKHASVALTETVKNELRAAGAPIRITSICPGLVKTEICGNNTIIKDIVFSVPVLLPEDIADALIYALGTRPEVQISEMSIETRGEISY